MSAQLKSIVAFPHTVLALQKFRSCQKSLNSRTQTLAEPIFSR